MATVNDLIATYMQVEGVLAQRRAQELQEQNSLVNRLALMQEMAAQMHSPEGIGELARSMEQSGVGGTTDLDVILGATAPGQGVTQRGLAREGLGAMGLQQRSGLAGEAATQEATGMTELGLEQEDFLSAVLPHARSVQADVMDSLSMNYMTRLAAGELAGPLAQADAFSRMSPEELEEGAGVGMGTRASENALIQAEIAAEGHRQQWMLGVKDSALREELAREGWAHDWNMMIGQVSLEAKARGDINATAEIQNLVSTQRNLEANKNTMSDVMIDQHLQILSVGFRRLREAGYPTPENLTEGLTHDDVRQSSFSYAQKWWQGLNRSIGRR